jgi:lipoyl-dependent peroxiredoxin
MVVHRGAAWLDARPIRTSVVPPDNLNVAEALAINVQFEERPAIRPEEVLATAHAASYCLSLWNRLKQAGHKPTHLHTTAFVHVDAASSSHSESEIHLNTDANVPGLNEERFALHARAAKMDFVALRGLSGIPVKVEPHLHA